MQLTFYKKQRGYRIPETATLSVYLILDNWNDFSYRTLYQITIFDENSVRHNLGYIKIANFGQTTDERMELPDTEFERLGDDYFSLGQSTEYYKTIQMLNPLLKEIFLTSIKDIVYNQELLNAALREAVTTTSFLRSTSLVTIHGQYKRILDGNAELTPFHFMYRVQDTTTAFGYELEFNVEPNSNPPTNIHVMIGRNGVGKTHLFNNMVKSFIVTHDRIGEFQHAGVENGESFSRLVSVSYSAFDPFNPYSERDYPTYSYIGLKKEEIGTTKSHDELAQEFFMSINYCFNVGKKEKWFSTVRLLESDPLFGEINIMQLSSNALDQSEVIRFFKRLSSGHSIVLLTITKLVEKIEEKTLVLLDEPEAHLHPPLLSAFIRALSNLLINKNAVAIIATHSPVIAQEVPQSCIWKLSRSGRQVNAERFETETFGETIGKLTREVFGLEVNESGFYKLLSDEVSQGYSYEEIIQRYNNQLGFEARLLLRALLNNSGE